MPYRLANITSPKLCAVLLGGGGLLSLVMPIVPLIILTIAFAVIDFVAGLIVSIRIKKQGFVSGRAYKTMFKIGGSMICVMAMYAIEMVIFKVETPYITRCIAGIFCGFDFWSFAANFAILSDHPVFRYVRKFAKHEIESKMNKIIDNLQ